MTYFSSSFLGMVMFFIGVFLKFIAPYDQGRHIGYKSPISLKNNELWRKSNSLCGFLFMLFGVVYTISFYLMGQVNIETSYKFILIVFVGLLFLSFFITEFYIFFKYLYKK